VTSYANSVIAEGQIDIELTWTPPHVNAVRLSSSRSPDACRVLEGKSASEAIRILPLLFNICGRAQAVAGVNAIEQAARLPSDPGNRQARPWLVRLELVQEYLWRLLLDLPKLFQLSPAMEAFVSLRQKLQKAVAPVVADGSWLQPGATLTGLEKEVQSEIAVNLRDLLEGEVLGCEFAEWQALQEHQVFLDWLTRNGTVVGVALNRLKQKRALSVDTVELLPAANHASWLEEVADSLASIPHFSAAPLWRGSCYETGALARCQEHPLISALLNAGEDIRLLRFVARIVELVDSAEWFAKPQNEREDERWLGGEQAGKGAGFGWGETARGLLLHYVVLEQERVGAYRILAPTEWNFNPEGALMRELSMVQAHDEATLRDQAKLSVVALDPCVEFDVRVNHA